MKTLVRNVPREGCSPERCMRLKSRKEQNSLQLQGEGSSAAFQHPPDLQLELLGNLHAGQHVARGAQLLPQRLLVRLNCRGKVNRDKQVQ